MARAALGCALGVFLILGGSLAGAMAGESDDPEDSMPDTQFFRGVLKGLGLRKDGDGIDYRERSPLVVPQSRDLPPPEDQVEAKPAAANWPVDAEAKRRKAAAAAARKLATTDVSERSRPLRPNEITTVGTDVKGNQQTATGPNAEPTDNLLNPTALGFKGFTFDNLFGSKPSTATFTSEPGRSSLTEPPVGYRTPAANQPYGVSDDKNPAGTGKACDFYRQHGEANSTC